MTTINVRALALATVLLAACGSAGTTTPRSGPPSSTTTASVATGLSVTTSTTHVVDPEQRAAFLAARKRWEAAGVRSYRMQLAAGCECPMSGRWDIVVREGAPVSATPQETSAMLHLDNGFRTVDELFDQLDSALGSASSVTVSYDPVLGYPAQVRVDVIANAVDDEFGWSIAAFTPDA